jgi:O-antigen/teichoic acid export membrane protein
MRTHLANAAYGVLDYAAYPLGMLIVAPIVLHNMGAAQYGVWAVATAAVSMGSIVASGFGDANIQNVANQRGLGNYDALLRTVRSMVGINLVLGTAFALLAWTLVPYAARHMVLSNVALQYDCLWSLRFASILIWLRTLESVCISTQRAFERYGAAVRISICARLLSLAVAAGLTWFAQSVAAMVAAATVFTLFGTGLQFVHLRRLLHAPSLLPVFDKTAVRALLAFGAFSWLQAVSGVVFGQADRLLLGISHGAVAVASYALCVQLSQLISGFAASGLHFLFPYLAGRCASQSADHLRKPVLAALVVNLLFVAASTAILLAFGMRILRAWGGEAGAQTSPSVLSTIVWSSALLGLNVTGTYSLFALGRVKIVTWLNLAGGAVMLLLMFYLLPRFGAEGLTAARLSYGSITLFVYIPLARQLYKRSSLRFSAATPNPVGEEART